MDLASVYQQLSELRRENDKIDDALLENMRGIKVLETLVNKRLVPANEAGTDLETLRSSVSNPATGSDVVPSSSDTTTSAP